MARARICDRCNKTVTDNDEYYTIEFKKYYIKRGGAYDCPNLYCELCSDCLNKFVDFMKMYI